MVVVGGAVASAVAVASAGVVGVVVGVAGVVGVGSKIMTLPIYDHAPADLYGYTPPEEPACAECGGRELERLREDRDLWKQSEATCAKHYDKLLAENERLRAEVARYRENLRHCQGRFLNINIALASGGTKREAIAIADLGENCCKGYLDYDSASVRIQPVNSAALAELIADTCDHPEPENNHAQD